MPPPSATAATFFSRSTAASRARTSPRSRARAPTRSSPAARSSAPTTTRRPSPRCGASSPRCYSRGSTMDSRLLDQATPPVAALRETPVITEAEFRALAAQGYNRIPLVLESFADLDTPLSLYLKLANQRYTFLLESVVGGERFGRYSFIGLPAKIRIRVRGRRVEVEDRGGVVERHEGDPLRFLQSFMGRYRAAPQSGLPRFCGGLAGYFGYDP